MRKPPIGKSLAEVNPELAKEWHSAKNGELTPYDVTSSSGKKVWWKCPKGHDHEYESQISNRNNGTKCPVCAGRLIVKSNSLATLRPDLAKEWHPFKNGELTPKDVGVSMGKKVWWKCPKGEDHEWEDSLNHRSSGRGCPFCSSHRVSVTNSLDSLYPELAKEWHPKNNKGLTPKDIMPGSTKRVWWKCFKGENHEWEASPNTRTQGHGCPVCSGHKVVKSNSLAFLKPELAKEWHPNKNNNLTPKEVTIGTPKKVWWKCPKGNDHVWKASVNSRVRGNGCPVCVGQKVARSNSLETLYPAVLNLWHPSKNKGIKPSDFTAGTRKKVWWKCPKGKDHEWEASIVHVVNGKRCPICAGLKVVESNSLKKLKPKIAKQWHPTLNGTLTPSDVTIGTNTKVWWKCSKSEGHEWISSVVNRVKGRECPFCTLTPQSRQELQITFELKQFFYIDPKGFKTKINGKLWTIDIYLEELNLGIEFDGNYWHKDKRSLDKLKTEKLHEEGFTVMRIREEPLKPITDIDVVSKRPFNGKKVTNAILRHILEVYDIDKKREKKMKEYFRKRKLQNEDALDEYIDQILEEKEERKRKRK